MKASQIRKIRLKLFLTQAQAALKFGVSQSAWSRWESGVTTPRAAKLKTLQRAWLSTK